MKHELFEELDAVCPKWQQQFRTLREAAQRHDLLEQFDLFLQTDDGKRYIASLTGVRDWQAVNERNRKERERVMRMAQVATR